MPSQEQPIHIPNDHDDPSCDLCPQLILPNNALRCEECHKYAHYSCLNKEPGIFYNMPLETIAFFNANSVYYLCENCRINLKLTNSSLSTSLRKALNYIDDLKTDNETAFKKISVLKNKLGK